MQVADLRRAEIPPVGLHGVQVAVVVADQLRPAVDAFVEVVEAQDPGQRIVLAQLGVRLDQGGPQSLGSGSYTRIIWLPPTIDFSGAATKVNLRVRAVGTNAVDRLVASVMEVAAVNPEVIDKIDWDQWIDNMSEMLGVSTDMIISNENVQALRQARAKMMAQQEEVALKREQAATAKDAGTVSTGPAPEDNLAADVLNSGAPQEAVAV